MAVRPVKVSVAGQTLALRSDASAAYLRELATIVDQRLAQVREKHGAVSTQALALLCALQMADELTTLRAEVRERTRRILHHLDSVEWR
jgi:cell division protein ZapA (FtsZ GTPase activity inhibitor)